MIGPFWARYVAINIAPRPRLVKTPGTGSGSRGDLRTLGWGQLWIVARPDPQQFINHELVLATLDLNLLDGSGYDVGPDSLDHAVADTDRSAKFLVDPFEPCRDVDP